MTSCSNTGTYGFTMLQMALVMVVIALVMGAVIVGKDMIRMAELRRVIVSKDKLIVAIRTFQARYGGLPGDFDNAYSLLPGAVAGNNDGVIGDDLGTLPSSDLTEVNNVYVHLGQADLIEGTYTAASFTTVGAGAWTIGTNAPEGPLPGTVWWLGSSGTQLAYQNPGTFNMIQLTETDWSYGTFRLEDALTMDIKFDDGKPSTGDIRSYSGGVGGGGCVTAGVPVYNTTYKSLSSQTTSNSRDCKVEFGRFD